MINKYSIYMLLFLLLIMLINFSIVLYYIFKSKKKEKFAVGTAMDFHNIIQKINSGKLSDFINDETNYDDTPPTTDEKTYIISYITEPSVAQLACPAQQEPEVFPPILFIRKDQDTIHPVLPDDYNGYDFSQDFVLGKYPQNDRDWIIKYNDAKAATKDPNPIVIYIPVIKGDPGIDGRTPECEKGPPGEPGQNIYDTCLQGVKGDDGPQGPRGDKGPSGIDCICEPGLPGPRGLDGIPGQPGISHGEPGTPCVCQPGIPGLPGDAGTSGINGKNCKYIHELDSYLQKHIYQGSTGFASAPYIKMGLGSELLLSEFKSFAASDYNVIYFDSTSKTYNILTSTQPARLVDTTNYIFFITNKV